MKHQKFQSGCSLSMIASPVRPSDSWSGGGRLLRAAAPGDKQDGWSTNTRSRVYVLRGTTLDTSTPQLHESQGQRPRLTVNLDFMQTA
jgi:hypothetical protein